MVLLYGKKKIKTANKLRSFDLHRNFWMHKCFRVKRSGSLVDMKLLSNDTNIKYRYAFCDTYVFFENKEDALYARLKYS